MAEREEFLDTYQAKYGNINNTFRMVDQNGDCRLSQHELQAMLYLLNPSTFDSSSVKAVMESIDLDKNGIISVQEFVAWLTTVGSMEDRLQRSIADKRSMMKDEFARFDQNGDGRLSRKEMKNLLLSMVPQASQEQYIESIMSDITFDEAGKIGVRDFMAWVSDYINRKTIEEQCYQRNQDMVRLFETVDTDASGDVSESELSTVLKALDPRFTDDVVQRLIDRSSPMRNSGKVNYKEFVSWIMGTGLTPRLMEQKAQDMAQGAQNALEDTIESQEVANATESRTMPPIDPKILLEASARNLPPNWKPVLSRSRGTLYYWNVVTGERTWSRPSDNDDPKEVFSNTAGR